MDRAICGSILFVTVFVSTVAGDTCPQGWTLEGDSCYNYIDNKYTWLEAKAVCETIGGHLVEIQTEDEDDFISGLLRDRGVTTYAWIGLNDFAMEGTYVWTSARQAPQYTNWAANDPNNYDGNEDCGVIETSTGFWKDWNCIGFKLTFVCEAPCV